MLGKYATDSFVYTMRKNCINSFSFSATINASLLLWMLLLPSTAREKFVCSSCKWGFTYASINKPMR